MAAEDWYLDSTEQRAHDGARQAGNNFYEHQDHRGSAQPIFNQGLSASEADKLADRRAEPLRIELRELKKSLKAAEKAYESKTQDLEMLQKKRKITKWMVTAVAALALLVGSVLGYNVSKSFGAASKVTGPSGASSTPSEAPPSESPSEDSSMQTEADSIERVNAFLRDFDEAAKNQEFDDENRVREFLAFPLTWYNWGANDRRTKDAEAFASQKRKEYVKSQGRESSCKTDPVRASTVKADGDDVDVDGYVRMKAGCGDQTGETVEVTYQLTRSAEGQPYRISCVWDEKIEASDTCWS